MNRKLTAALLIAAAVLTNAAFTVLGTIFNYPDVLKEPVEDILAAFRAKQTAVMVEDFTLQPDEKPFDLVFAIRVGALDGWHPPSRRAGNAADRRRHRPWRPAADPRRPTAPRATHPALCGRIAFRVVDPLAAGADADPCRRGPGVCSLGRRCRTGEDFP